MTAPGVPVGAGGRAHGPRALDLFAQFFRREATTRYLGSVTGLAWALVHPIALLAVYHFVFTTIFRATGFAGASFLAFVAVALWPWLAAQEAIQRAAVSVPGYGGLIRKVAFPHEIVVYASSPRRSRCISPATSSCSRRCARPGSPFTSPDWCSRFRCGRSWPSR
jgi:hypothetical protein